ncbi:MAG: hypothetical protein A2103_03165 [Gammaproteobacteria bacterium GWF2_41_13]|nr:MAG: hypothetical protein A2103_03165 [Gammaproteobacteria bacterium GWF2_41_13]
MSELKEPTLSDLNLTGLYTSLIPTEETHELSLAIMNLIAIEEHLVYSGAKTHKTSYYDIIQTIRPIAESLLNQLEIPSALQSLSLKILAASMRLMEVGTKQWSLNHHNTAQDLFQKAYELLQVFFSMQNHYAHKTQPTVDAQALQTLNQQLDQWVHLSSATTLSTHAASEPVAREIPIPDVQTLVEQFDTTQKQNKLDLSADQDLTIGIMNLIGLEEEFFILGARSNNPSYYESLSRFREIRKNFMQKLIRRYEGEVWCMSKHLMAASMHLMQAGFHRTQKNAETAYSLFQTAYDLYALFWGLNLDFIQEQNTQPAATLLGKLGGLVKKIIDCCIE